MLHLSLRGLKVGKVFALLDRLLLKKDHHGRPWHFTTTQISTMHHFSPLCLFVVILEAAALALPQPESTKRTETSVNSLAAVLGLTALAVSPFLLAPHADLCLMEALKIREMQRSEGRLNHDDHHHHHHSRWTWVRDENHHAIPTGRSTVQELADYCRALYRFMPGRDNQLDLSRRVYRPILAQGLSRCIKRECKHVSLC